MFKQLQRLESSAGLLGVSCVAALAFGMTGAALAAGSGYGGSEPSTSAPPPTGFSSVLTAKTVGSKGCIVKAHTSGGTVSVTVPTGASKGSFQVAITKGSGSTVKKDLSSALAKYGVVAEFGVELKHGPSAATTSKPLTVTFKSGKIMKGDIVVVYDSKTGKFVKTTATVKNGAITIHLKAGESIAILALKKK